MATKPSIGLHLLVKNGESVVERLVDCVGPYVHEVVAVLNDCSDDTGIRLLEAASRNDLVLRMYSVTAESHPHLYFDDVPASYEVGRSLRGEKLDVPYTGRPILGDWAGARNVGWEHGKTRWRLMLDADDVVDDSECLPMLVSDLGACGVEVASSEYQHATVGGRPAVCCLRERLAIQVPAIRWEGAVHEKLAGYEAARAAVVRGQLRVRDMRDSSGEGLRIPARNLKVLYRAGRLAGWDVSKRHLAFLAAEAQACHQTSLAVAAVEKYFEGTPPGSLCPWPEEAVWVACQAGEAYEDEGCPGAAAEWYERGVAQRPDASPAACFRLARVRHVLGDHLGTVRAFEQGVVGLKIPQAVDGGIVLHDAARCLAIGSYAELGRCQEARSLCGQALASHPDDVALRIIMTHLEDLARGT